MSFPIGGLLEPSLDL